MIKRKYMKLLFALYLLVLLKVIVFKYTLGILREIAGTWSKEVLWEGLSGANFVLFRTIKMYIRHWNNRGLNSFGNLVGNVVTFIPLGYFLPRLWKPMRHVLFCLFTGLIFISGIALSQLISAFGVLDVHDILLNGMGVLGGLLVFRAAEKIFLKKLQ